MAIPVLIIGKSGSGKSASLRNLNPEQTALINVLGKPLPFRGNFTQLVTDSYAKIGEVIRRAARDIMVIDDAGYLISNMFMRGHSSGGGNSVFSLYNQIGDCFWQMVEQIRKAPSQGRVYVIMHEDKSDVGDIKPRTIGKLLDEKVCLEGMFTICLRCVFTDGRHVFRTQSDGLDVSKSPMGMFDALEIDNDLAAVDKAICEYYGIGQTQSQPPEGQQS